MKNTYKILIGGVDIGWRIKEYKRFLTNNSVRKLSINSFVKYKVSTKHFNASYDYEVILQNYPKWLRGIISLLYFIFFLINYDCFYFFSGETILSRRLRRFEFYFYRILGKRLIMHFVGSDIRNPEYLYWKSENIYDYLNHNIDHNKSTNWQKQLISDSSKRANKIIVSTPDLLDIIPDAIYFPVVINIQNYIKDCEKVKKRNSNHFFQTKKIKILHAPSNVELKGSKIIDQVLKDLEKSENIEYLYTKDLKQQTNSLYTVNRYDLFQLYQEADIVIDQLIIGWYGLQSIEALLSGCKVFCYIENKYNRYLNKNCPIINTNAKTLKQDVLNLVNNWKKPNQKEVNNWVERNHTLEGVRNKLFSIFES